MATAARCPNLRITFVGHEDVNEWNHRNDIY